LKRFLALLLSAAALSGCVANPPVQYAPPELVVTNNNEFNALPAPAGGKVVAAVYKFEDKTGQRKPSDKLANISYAVTQGAETWVIKALQEVGNGEWFRVVERVGLDELTKERQIIRQARQSVGDTTELKPMLFAGVIVAGGITGYDSNTLTGGSGARYLGIGPSTEYRQDVVTVSMRLVSVQTGEVLVNTSVTKTIVSYGDHVSVFKFLDMGTRALEIESGTTENEPVNYAVRTAIEQCVVEMVKEGERKGIWSFKTSAEEVSDTKEFVGPIQPTTKDGDEPKEH
jgi:curli production assembly/transport component CsgG